MATIPPIPNSSPVIEEPLNTLSKDYYIWLDLAIRQRLQATPQIVATADRPSQSATIATTTLWTATGVGFFRLSPGLHITTVDGVSSSATLTIKWTDAGTVQTRTYPAVNGDLLTSLLSDPALTFHTDTSTVITYAVLYASNTPATMKYRLNLALEVLL